MNNRRTYDFQMFSVLGANQYGLYRQLWCTVKIPKHEGPEDRGNVENKSVYREHSNSCHLSPFVTVNSRRRGENQQLGWSDMAVGESSRDGASGAWPRQFFFQKRRTCL